MDAATLHGQHLGLFVKVRQLNGTLQRNPLPAEDAAEQAKALGMALKQHFNGERQGLYGRLLRDPDPTTRALAQICQEEAKATEAALEAFVLRWTVALHIARDPEGFRATVRSLVILVGRRTGLEERDLMPRLESSVA